MTISRRALIQGAAAVAATAAVLPAAAAPKLIFTAHNDHVAGDIVCFFLKDDGENSHYGMRVWSGTDWLELTSPEGAAVMASTKRSGASWRVDRA